MEGLRPIFAMKGVSPMRMMYITSGMVQLYPHRFIDQFIARALSTLADDTRVFELNSGSNWQSAFLHQLAQFAPDYVFTMHGVHLSPEVVQQIQHGGAKVGIWFVDDPYDLDESKQRLYGYDFVFTNESAAIPVYQRQGAVRVRHLALGTDVGCFFPETPPLEYRSDLCIVGSPFPRRVELVNGLVQQCPHLQVKVVGPQWREYGIVPLVEVVPHHVGPEEARRYYNGAKINLNIHREAGEQYAAQTNLNREGIPAHSPNNRTFDIAACRAFQLADFRPQMCAFYDPGNELVVFTDEEDLQQKVQQYLRADTLRARIAERAYARTVSEHGYGQRLARMAAIVQGQILQEIAAEVHTGLLVKDDRPTVYLVLRGRKHPFPCEACFHQLGGSWERVQVWPRERVDALPQGVALVENFHF